MRSPSQSCTTISPTLEKRVMVSPSRGWKNPRYSASRQDTGQVYVKHEKDLDDDELMTIPTPDPDQPSCKRRRTQSSCLPILSRSFVPSLDDDLHLYHDHEHHIHMLEPRLVEVHDEDQMSIQQEAQNKRYVVEDDAESVSSVVTIRQVPLSPISEFGEARELALASTAEYQSALFGMLEEMCTEAARRYWQDVASQAKFCLLSRRDTALYGPHAHPNQSGQYPQPGTQPIRTSRSNERLRARHRVDPYPIHRGDSNVPQLHGMRSHIYNFYGLQPDLQDEDTRMSLSLSPPSPSLDSPNRHKNQSLNFLDLISKIANHIWRTERHHSAAPYRAEFLTARKSWNVWRSAEVVVRAVDGYDGFGDERFERFPGGIKCKEEVVGVVEAAGELCGILGDVVGRERCEELVMSWELEERDELEEGEIVE